MCKTIVRRNLLFLVLQLGLISLYPLPSSAHSGGTDEIGCHAGSEPYHCHNEGEQSSNSAPTSAGSGRDGFSTALSNRLTAKCEDWKFSNFLAQADAGSVKIECDNLLIMIQSH